jgi:hypothetical protein
MPVMPSKLHCMAWSGTHGLLVLDPVPHPLRQFLLSSLALRNELDPYHPIVTPAIIGSVLQAGLESKCCVGVYCDVMRTTVDQRSWDRTLQGS